MIRVLPNSLLVSLLAFAPMPGVLQGQLPDPTASGAYTFTTFDSTFTDDQFSNTDISARYYIPDAAGEDFPVLVFGHGFTASFTDYLNLYVHFASWGYVVAALDEQNGLNISHSEFAQQMLGTISMLESENNNVSSRFYQRISGKAAVMGHSMGGGSSMIAGVEAPQLVDAVVGLAPAETNPPVIDDMQDMQAELLIVSGRGDAVTPETTVQIPMYNAATMNKLWVSLLEGGHCAFTDGNTVTCELGAAAVGDAGTLSYAEQQGLAKKYSTPFLEFHLRGEQKWDEYVCGTIAADDPAVEHQTNYTCLTLIRSALNETHIQLFPNPAAEVLTVQIEGRHNFSCVDALGRQFELPAKPYANRALLDVIMLPAGVYVLKSENQTLGRFVKQ